MLVGLSESFALVEASEIGVGERGTVKMNYVVRLRL